MAEAILALENNLVFRGQGFGAQTQAVFELVFNTSMTGYQEILTDPSYRGQGVLFTTPHIGNVGINLEDYEAAAPQVSALVVRALSPQVSNWRAQGTLHDWLGRHGIPGISGVDTRAITHRLRAGGTVKAALSTLPDASAPALVEQARRWSGLDGLDMVCAVTLRQPEEWCGDAADPWVANDLLVFSPPAWPRRPLVLVYDYGVKRNMARHVAAWGAQVVVLPADYPAEQALAYHPDGILLSNGPGDPAGLPYAVEIVGRLLESEVPIFGICLGHQLIGRALGGETRRLKFGHHGGNHPVQDLRNKKVLITAQNHNYVVDLATLKGVPVEATHLSLNDGSLEGMRLLDRPVFSVQFHPEAAPGPHDAHGLFAAFFDLILQRLTP